MQPIENKIPTLSEIKWRARRGMLELDFILTRFIDEQFVALNDEEKIQLSMLLQHEDTELWDWLVLDKINEIPSHLKKICAFIQT